MKNRMKERERKGKKQSDETNTPECLNGMNETGARMFEPRLLIICFNINPCEH